MVFRLSQSYLKLVNACKKRFMPQNGQIAVSKCSLLWKKMRKSFGKSELKLKFIWKFENEKLWLKNRLKGCSSKIEILILNYLFKPDNLD